MDDIFNSLNRPTRQNYSLEEIEAAKKRQKSHGGTIMDNLAVIAPNKSLVGGTGASGSIPVSSGTEDIKQKLKELQQNMSRDFGIEQQETATTVTGASTLERFNGITDVLRQTVFGQDEFLKKLVIAFKRPFVMDRAKEAALNSIYLYGPSCTGKHLALSTLVAELNKRGILKYGDLHFMDLSLYPTVAEEKLFLQDLYSALHSKAPVIVFEHYEDCHISLLNRLTDLAATGKCNLSERYVMQNGQLVNVANAFAGDTVGSFEAGDKYLVFLSTRPVEKLADVMGAPFINALGDLCATGELDREALQKISLEKEKQLISKCKKQLSYELIIEQDFRDYVLEQSSKGRALTGILETYGNTLKALSQLRLERDDLPSAQLTLSCPQDVVVTSGQETISLSRYLPGGYNGELDSVKAQLNDIIGLKEVKEYIYSLEEYFGVQKRRQEAGLKTTDLNKHMIFTGNPGTGKTTIARIVSKYLKAIGVLSGGQLVEVSRADLVGRYVGHTAPLVNQVIKSALGGVLFIDEAYSLHRGENDNFGLEAVDTLVKGIEDNRDNLIVILAGYSQEMEEFLESNSGLKSRFPNIIDFPDYTGEELYEIAKLTARSKGYRIDDGAKDGLLAYFNLVQATRAREAGNGRLVRNKVEDAILNQSRRLVAEPEADMSLLLSSDFDLND